MAFSNFITRINPKALNQWLTVLAIGAWGILLLKYWVLEKLGLLIHPNYFGIVIMAGVFMAGLAIAQGLTLWKNPGGPKLQHFSLIPPIWLTGILLGAALVGILGNPRPFTSQTALQRGLQDASLTRRTQSFRTQTNPEKRSLLDWVTTLDAYPEPDAYTNQKVNVEGFVVHTDNLPDDYLTLTRFVITCCATDVYPVGFPVKLEQSRTAYPEDQWFRIQGDMQTEILNDRRQLVIQAKTLETIPEPKNPYDY